AFPHALPALGLQRKFSLLLGQFLSTHGRPWEIPFRYPFRPGKQGGPEVLSYFTKPLPVNQFDPFRRPSRRRFARAFARSPRVTSLRIPPVGNKRLSFAPPRTR